MNRIPNEILHQVLGKCAGERNTLHACLLVDRRFCTVAVRLLWSNPFSLTPATNRDALAKLAKLYLQCFTREDKCILRKRTIFQYASVIQDAAPTFPYLTYLQHLSDTWIVDAYASAIPMRKRANSARRKHKWNLIRLLFARFLLRCGELHALRLEMDNVSLRDEPLRIIRQRHSSLAKLEFAYETKLTKHLVDPYVEALCAILRAQTRVESVSLRNFRHGLDCLGDAIAACRDRSRQLRCVAFTQCSLGGFPWERAREIFDAIPTVNFEGCFGVDDNAIKDMPSVSIKGYRYWWESFLPNVEDEYTYFHYGWEEDSDGWGSYMSDYDGYYFDEY